MAQHDGIISNDTGANVRSDINNALSAIFTTHSGATEPSTTYSYQLWMDTSSNVLKIRNSANSAWYTLPISPVANNTVDINGGTVDGITSLSVSGTSSLNGAVVINESGADVDFRIESDTNDNAFFLEGSSGNVGIGTSSPGEPLSVYGDSTNSVAAYIENNNASGAGAVDKRLALKMGGSSGSGITGWQNAGIVEGTSTGGLYLGAYNGAIKFATGSSARNERMRIDSSGRILIGKTSSDNAALDIDFNGAGINGVQIDNTGGGGPYLLQILSGGTIMFYLYNDGSLLLPAVYSDTVTSARDLYIQSNGKIGYVSSTRASKTNIEDLTSVDWLYQLNPVKFQYRTQDEEENYTEIAEDQIEYGLIAE
jgi:hypothetical protein